MNQTVAVLVFVARDIESVEGSRTVRGVLFEGAGNLKLLVDNLQKDEKYEYKKNQGFLKIRPGVERLC